MESKSIKVGIIGATGYAGAELVRLLLSHPQAELAWLGSKSYAGQAYADVYRNMNGLVDMECGKEELIQAAGLCDVIFTATPQGYLDSIITEELLQKTKVIDLSADFRIQDVAAYEAWYHRKHESPSYIREAAYGLCELNREAVPGKRLVANPGCYATCSILALYPLLAEGVIEAKGIVIDAKSGTSGAGRGAKTDNLFCEVNETIKAYGVASHRHTPEIEEQLGKAARSKIVLNFTPHLVPMNRGILVTAYADRKDGVSAEDVRAAFEKWYGKEFFIRLLPAGECAQTRWVKGSNFVDIGFTPDERTGKIIITAALDNLVKGAAGQAVQNMNLLFGLEEECGLTMAPCFP